MGANIKLFPSREDDFLGISYGVFKGQTPCDGERAEHNREQVLEVMYSFQVNDYFKVVPHFQYIANPAYSTSAKTFSGAFRQSFLSDQLILDMAAFSLKSGMAGVS